MIAGASGLVGQAVDLRHDPPLFGEWREEHVDLCELRWLFSMDGFLLIGPKRKAERERLLLQFRRGPALVHFQETRES